MNLNVLQMILFLIFFTLNYSFLLLVLTTPHQTSHTILCLQKLGG